MQVYNMWMSHGKMIHYDDVQYKNQLSKENYKWRSDLQLL